MAGAVLCLAGCVGMAAEPQAAEANREPAGVAVARELATIDTMTTTERSGEEREGSIIGDACAAVCTSPYARRCARVATLHHCIDADCFERCNAELKRVTPSSGYVDDSVESVGEAKQPWTRADCQRAFVNNYRQCESWPPNVKPVCYATYAGLLVACIAGAEG